ncbi:MAG: hypothetical protein SGPRY_009768 [Prymnesium sp.]
MSSLNPFTARREKQEERVKERSLELAAYEQAASTSLPPSFASPEPQALFADSYAAEDFDKYLPASAKSDQPANFSYNGGGTYEAPSRARQCFSKLQTGFMIGASLGGAFGFLYGSYAAVVYRHVLYLPISVVQAGGAFGFFLACGTVIRCDEPTQSLSPARMAQLCTPRPQVALCAARPAHCAVVSAIVGEAQQ